MADRPWATAPERSMAALSTSLTFRSGALDPAHDLVRGAARGHAAADEQDVDFFLDNLRIAECCFCHCVHLLNSV